MGLVRHRRNLTTAQSRDARPRNRIGTFDRLESSNYQKFQTRNPVVRSLIDRFYENVREIVAPLAADSTLDAGCGEGETMLRLDPVLGRRLLGVDISEPAVALASERVGRADVRCASVYELPVDRDQFDLVLCLEVLEHLEDPDAALRELARASRSDVVVSVPFEPWFQLGSAFRGKYLRTLGNHPEHINHWGRKSLAAFLGRQLDLIELRVSTPWLIAHGRPMERE